MSKASSQPYPIRNAKVEVQGSGVWGAWAELDVHLSRRLHKGFLPRVDGRFRGPRSFQITTLLFGWFFVDSSLLKAE